jgi:hypothetical protein
MALYVFDGSQDAARRKSARALPADAALRQGGNDADRLVELWFRDVHSDTGRGKSPGGRTTTRR